MNRERFYELLINPYSPYILVELVYIVIAVIFNLKLNGLNQLLYQNFDIDRMLEHKDVMIASDVMAYEGEISWNYFGWGLFLIVLGVVIPILAIAFNNASYKKDDVKMLIWLIILAMVIINIMMIISIAKALFSPIVVAICLISALSIFVLAALSQS